MPSEPIPKLVLVNPVNEAIQTDSTLAPRLAALDGKRVGLLDNSKSKAGQLLDAVAAILQAQHGFTALVRQRKPSASKPAAPEVIDEFAKTCDLVLVGVGD
jgi:predicted GTPase